MLATQIVASTGRWPANTVLYDQAGTDSPTGHRPDCSGYASMCLGLPVPGENTVTLLTKGVVRPIGWADLAPGDVVGALGPGTAGDVGHVMVVIGVHAPSYDVMEQGGGYGPGRGTYRIGDGQGRGFLPYRLSTLGAAPSTVEVSEMATIVLNVEDNQYYALGSDGRARKLAMPKGVGIDDVGFVLSGKYRPGGKAGDARPGVLCSNPVIGPAPHIDIPAVPLSVIAVAAEAAPGGPAQVDVKTLAAALADPAVVKALTAAAFAGAQQAERE